MDSFIQLETTVEETHRARSADSEPEQRTSSVLRALNQEVLRSLPDPPPQQTHWSVKEPSEQLPRERSLLQSQLEVDVIENGRGSTRAPSGPLALTLAPVSN